MKIIFAIKAQQWKENINLAVLEAKSWLNVQF